MKTAMTIRSLAAALGALGALTLAGSAHALKHIDKTSCVPAGTGYVVCEQYVYTPTQEYMTYVKCPVKNGVIQFSMCK
ncbi:hypothetical protein HNR42_000448 [Deinobacterium chartae]|uniref:Uncharacterized protein n=1 Tax=Deinobacterium chartae TaxID=521158 RepID=A0A841HWK8_9DEIO|nr:hypothetical protein [Deinobacterium chartae]MBB6097034.1 hypothetical protein [Deinobacterium chartae]